MASNVSKIYLSESKKIIKITIDADIGEEKVTHRRAEIEMMIIIFRLAARFSSKIVDGRECRDMMEQFENIDDKVKYIEFTKDDLKHANEGFGKTMGTRPDAWLKECDSMLSQIEKPFNPKKKIVFDKDLNCFKEVD